MTCCPVGSFPEDRTVLGEGAEDLRAGGDIETPDSGVRHRRFGNYKTVVLTMILIVMCVSA